MKAFSKILGCTCVTAAAGLGIQAAQAADWSATNVHLMKGQSGKAYDFGTGTTNASRDTITLEHASGWKYGDNYFFVDLYMNDYDASSTSTLETEAYAEAYSNFSYNKISGSQGNLAGPLQDVALQVGINQGNDFQVLVYGINTYWDIPGFSFASLSVIAYDDQDGPAARRGASGGIQITPVWAIPVDIGSTKWQLNGFADITTDRGAGTKDQFLIQPKVLFDLGHSLWGDANKMLIGFEYSYWENKFGLDIETEKDLQLMVQFNL